MTFEIKTPSTGVLGVQVTVTEWVAGCGGVLLLRLTVLSVRFEVGVSPLLAPAEADKRSPKAPFALVGYAGIQPVICK